MAERFTRQSFSLTPPMLEDLRKEAAERDLSLSQLIRLYIRSGRLGQNRDALDLKRDEGGEKSGN